MNSVVLIGRLTRDPELRYTAGTQMAVATFTLAIDRPVRAGGEKQTDFPRVTVFGKQAENCEKPLQGDLNALIACCSEYTTLTTGHRLEGMMYSCSSLGIKLGGALGTAVCGWLLDAAGYVKNAAVQPATAVNMLQFLYLWMPVILCALVALLLVFLRVEKANAKLLAEKAE